MSSLEKRQANRRGSTHGPRKCSDGISDTSSVGSFMDDTDREVSNLTDRAFRSLCIGEDAIYNDLEVSSPADHHKSCPQEALQNKDLRTTCQESSFHHIHFQEAERKSEVASTFQRSYVDISQEHVLRDENLSYISNGCMEATWQQKRSTSRVSSLIKAFSSGESYCDSGAPDTEKHKYQDFNNESWDKSALLSIQRELSEFSSGYHPNFKPGSLQSYGNHVHAVALINTGTSSKTRFKALNTTNFFFHSEFSPFQLWKDYNRFPFERGGPSGFVSGTEFPRWYDSPLYKELRATHRISGSPAEGRQFTQRKIEDVTGSQRSRSTVIQKASAIEKRCESETASNCPPWKNNNFVRNKLPSNRPSTVSPTNEKVHRPDSSLLYHSRHTYEIQQKGGKVGSSEMPSRTTPFNITQLLTPVIPGRQETETSEILQFAHTPLVSECDTDLRPQSDAKLLRDSYKSKASSLLFNIKDNRKRVKSTYSPTKFNCSEISDRNKQPSKLEGRESRLSEASGSKVPIQEHSTAPGTWEPCNPVQPNYELSLFQTEEHRQYADTSHNNMALVSQYGTANQNIPYLGSQNSHAYQLTNRESEHYELSTNSGIGNSGGSPAAYINDSTRNFSRREDTGHQSFVRKPGSTYINNQVTEENLSWKKAGPINTVTREMVHNNGKDALPYKGEIAALIEMDKQRKATAKQYLPSANDSYTIRKETCINMVNENVNRSWLLNDKQIQDTKSSLQTYGDKCFSNKQIKNDYRNLPATYQDLFQHNGPKMASPPKEANFTRGTEITTPKKSDVCPQRYIKYDTHIEAEKDYNQRTQLLKATEKKNQYNEGSTAYQPYRYESNKQWHIAAENRHTKGDECVARQLQQSEIKAEQPGELNYVHSLSRTSCIQQQSTAYSARTSQRNLITEDRIKTQEHKPTYSITPSQIYYKRGDTNVDLKIPNTQRTLQNNNSSQTRGDRFNISDILSVRDNEQAKRVRENKHSFNGRTGDQPKLENITSSVTSDVFEEKVAKPESNEVQSQAQQDENSHSKHEHTNVSYGRKDLHHLPNDVKERSGKDIFPSNGNDKMTLRALSYKEKGQTKQEILTSKLKAHAQKEISAIKEKGLAKHAISSRNPTKHSTAISNEKGQMNQEVLSPKKEITAEKLNHLFQDITYSSVSIYKEQKNQSKDESTYEPSTSEKIELLTQDIGLEKAMVATEKERTKIPSQQDKITEVDKKNCEVQTFVQSYVYQPYLQSKENQLKPNKDNGKAQSTDDSSVTNETNLAECFTSSPTLKVFSDADSVVRKKDETSSISPTSNNKECVKFKANDNESPIHEVLVKAATNQLTVCNILGEAKNLERSVTKAKDQLPNFNTDKSTTDSNAVSLKCYDLLKTTESIANTRKGNTLMPPNARQLEISTRHDTPSDWMKDEVPAVKETVEYKDTKTGSPNKQTENTEQEIYKYMQSKENQLNKPSKENEKERSTDDSAVTNETNLAKCFSSFPTLKVYSDDDSAVKMEDKTSSSPPRTYTSNNTQCVKFKPNDTDSPKHEVLVKEREHLHRGAAGISEKQIECSESLPNASNKVYSKPNTEPSEKQTWLEEQANHTEAVQTSKTNELKQLQNTNSDTLESSQNIHASKQFGYQTVLSLNKAISIKLHSSEENKYSLQQEPQIKKLHHENGTVQEITELQPNLKIRHENQNQQIIKDKEVTENNNQQQNSEQAPESEYQNQALDSHEHIETTGLLKQSNDDTRTYNSSKSPGTEHEEPEEKLSMPIIRRNSNGQQLSSPPAPDKTASNTNPVTESHVIHIASKEDSSPTDEPVIYNICVSSTSEDISEDEPIIFSISVSSMSDASKTTGPENQENAQQQLSIEQVKKDDIETFSNKNKQSEFLKSKEDSKELKLLLNNDVAEQETVVRKYDSPAGKDKLDYNRSTEVDNISSSYESLLAKYGLPNGDTNCLESDQKQQDKNQEDEKEESTNRSLQKMQNNTVDIEHAPTEEILTSANLAKNHSPASTELLRNSKENYAQHVTYQEHQTASGGTQRVDGVVDSDRNTKLEISSKQELLMSKVVSVCEDTVDTQSAKQSVANGNVQLKENKQVGQKVQTMERALKENDEKVVNKYTQMVQVKCENVTQPIAGFNSTSSSNMSLNHSCDDLSQPSSTNDCQIRIKTQDTGVSSVQDRQNAVNQEGNTKIPTPQHNALKQEKLSKERLQTGDCTALQNNKKELVSKRDFPEPEQVKLASNEVSGSSANSTFTNEQSNENGSGNQKQIQLSFPTGKTDKSVLTVSYIPLDDKEVHKKDMKNHIKADTVSTRGTIPNNASENAQDKTPAKVTGTKAASALSMREVDLERLEDRKWKREPAQKERELIRNEITALNKYSKATSSVIKCDEDAECESSKIDKNLKATKTQPQNKKDEYLKKLISDTTRKNTGLKEIMAGGGSLKENSDIIRWDIERSGKVLGDKLVSNVCHPEKEALSEKKENTLCETIKNSQYRDTVLPKNKETFTKTEVTHREKKTTRPEISALADYARLRVISAEDDTITEKDVQKMNMYQKYNLSSVEPQKATFSKSVGGTEQSNAKLLVKKKPENVNATTAPLQVQEQQTYKITDEILTGHNQCSTRGEIITYPKLGSVAKSSDDRVFAVKDTESTKDKTNHMQSNTKKSLTSQDYRYSRSHEVYQPRNLQATLLVQTQTESKNDPKIKQPVNANMLERQIYPQVKNSQSIPPPQVPVETEHNNSNRHGNNQIVEEVNNEETEEELQYYIVNALECETKPKTNHEPLPLSHKITSKTDPTENRATTPRSNTSSPSMGKPIMFRVKDNTGKTSSVTKTVRPRFHKSFSEEFRIGSPVNSCSEKDKVEYDHSNDSKESATSPGLHEQSVTSHRLSLGKDIEAQNRMLSPSFIAPKEPRSYNRRSHMIEQDESRSLISRESEDAKTQVASSVVTTDSRGFDTEHIRHTYARPESSLYERPESACYERPESACSDIRPGSRPPTVLPKTEKGLRRAQKLISRRIRKVEDKLTSDTPVQSETKSIRTVSSLPASPMVQTSTLQSVQASPPISHYCVEPNYAPPAPNIVAHSFPVTQRKLLQDPNSGQIFMVDMPVQVKTKTFFDPETGKYVQLNVRQRAQSSLSQPAPVEVLGHPYVVYPGFLPMPVSVSSLPSVRSSSQMSAPATLTEKSNQLKARHEPSKKEICEPERHINIQQHNRPVYRTREPAGREILHAENVRMTPRQTHIITMSELEDFAVENT